MKAKLVKESLNSNLNEGFATTESENLDTIANWLEYEDFAEFIGDNPGCYNAIVQWIDETFHEKLLSSGLDADEIESKGLYDTAEYIRSADGKYVDD